MTETRFLAAEVAADLVERPLKVEVSIPESFKIHFIHLDKVEDVTSLCGESIDRNKGFGFIRNSWTKLLGQTFIMFQISYWTKSLILLRRTTSAKAFFGLDVLFNLGIVKLIPSCLKTLNYKSSLYSVCSCGTHQSHQHCQLKSNLF